MESPEVVKNLIKHIQQSRMLSWFPNIFLYLGIVQHKMFFSLKNKPPVTFLMTHRETNKQTHKADLTQTLMSKVRKAKLLNFGLCWIRRNWKIKFCVFVLFCFSRIEIVSSLQQPRSTLTRGTSQTQVCIKSHRDSRIHKERHAQVTKSNRFFLLLV